MMIKKVFYEEAFENFMPANHTINGINLFAQKATLESSYDYHTHDFSELVIITGGQAVHVIDGREYHITCGDIFVINGNIPHGFTDVNGLALFNVIFRPGNLPSLNGKLKELAGFQALFILEPYYRNDHNFESRLWLPPEKLRFVEEILNAMCYENNIIDCHYKFISENYFNALICYLAREYDRCSIDSKNKLILFAETVAFMEKNFHCHISLKELSDMAYFSTTHFIRIFKKIYSSSPIDYLQKIRIQHACKLLTTKGMSISEVAYETGFNDSNYFCRVFKKNMGVSPGKYIANR